MKFIDWAIEMENEYLNFIDQKDRDTKRVVSARVSEDVLNALNMAEADSESFGYSFSITSIIEKALNNTLSSIESNSGINYYELEKWQSKIKLAYQSLVHCIDFRNYTKEVEDVILLPFGKPPTSYDLKNIHRLPANETVSFSRDDPEVDISPQILKRMKQGRIQVGASIDLIGIPIEDVTIYLTSFIQ